MERDAALADFEVARNEWEGAFRRVPDGALKYLKPGDDYSLGGLLVHVNWVLAHYRRVLDGLIASGFGQIGLQDPPGAEQHALDGARRGLEPSERGPSLQEMGDLHQSVSRTIASLPASDWERKAPVIYGGEEDPYPTSPEDILGWLRDHYREHVTQCGDLLDEWRALRLNPGG